MKKKKNKNKMSSDMRIADLKVWFVDTALAGTLLPYKSQTPFCDIEMVERRTHEISSPTPLLFSSFRCRINIYVSRMTRSLITEHYDDSC